MPFEEEPVAAAVIAERMAEVPAAGLPCLVAEETGQVLGYAYADRWKARSAYRLAVESTVYLAPTAVGRGLGTALYAELFTDLRGRKLHTVIGGIALPNPASVALHEKFGIRKVAHFAETGFEFGRRIDVGYWQVMLEPPAE